MDAVTIYIETRIKGLKAKTGYYSYVLEYITAEGKQITRDQTGSIEDATECRLTLTALLMALKRLTKPCEIRINTKCRTVLTTFSGGWHREWEKKGWRTANGKPVKNADLWKKILPQMGKHRYTLETSCHEFIGWQQSQMEKEERNQNHA